MRTDIRLDQHRELENHTLMQEAGTRTHQELAVHQLVGLAVVRQREHGLPTLSPQATRAEQRLSAA